MKKTIFSIMFAMVLGCCMTSCNNTTTQGAEVDSTLVDSIAIDSIDSTVVDSLGQLTVDSVCAE
jgi:predicted small secreted protein